VKSEVVTGQTAGVKKNYVGAVLGRQETMMPWIGLTKDHDPCGA